jgi:colanic acid/amylovoran biosynthesis glycosyltransferase
MNGDNLVQQKPRVAHVTIPYLQPTETFIYDRIVHHIGYEPFVLTDEKPINLDLFPFDNIFSLESLSTASAAVQKLRRRAGGFLPFFIDVLKRERAAVIHAHYGPIGAALIPLKKKAGLPLITSFYGIDASAFLRLHEHSGNYARLWRDCEIISVLSENMKSALEGAGCPTGKLRVHHLAVDTDAIRPPASRPPAPPVRVFCAARLFEKKGVDVLIRAVAAARREAQIELDIAGRGPMENELKALAEKLGISGAVSFHGHVPREGIIRLMSESHIFALLSRTAANGDSEGTPNALIEAGAMGLPSVSTHHAGIPEMLVHDSGGILVEENDDGGAADALLRLAADENLRAAMGQSARRKIEAEFSIKNVMKQIEADYDSLIRT